MNSGTHHTREELAATYLQQLQALGLEISVAIGAISANQLETLQQSIATQESLCSSLATIAGKFGDGAPEFREILPSGADSAFDTRIRTARRAVVELNKQYEALLEHSGKSIALLISLCRTHTGSFREARGARLKQQTWSCEM